MTSPDTEFVSILGASGSPEAPPRVSSSSLPEVLPVLGLSDIVIFPGMVAPLLIETAQSTKLIDDVVGGDRLLGVVLQGYWRDYRAGLLACFKALKRPHQDGDQVYVSCFPRFTLDSANSQDADHDS